MCKSYRKFIFSHIVAAFSMLSSWLGVNRKAPLVRKSVSLISESVSWSCQSPEARRLSWFSPNSELFFDVDMSFSHVALPWCSLWDIFYTGRRRWDRLARDRTWPVTRDQLLARHVLGALSGSYASIRSFYTIPNRRSCSAYPRFAAILDQAHLKKMMSSVDRWSLMDDREVFFFFFFLTIFNEE